MMDCLKITDGDMGIGGNRHIVGILPGSKEEAYKNLSIILDAVKKIGSKSFLSRKECSMARKSSVSSTSRSWFFMRLEVFILSQFSRNWDDCQPERFKRTSCHQSAGTAGKADCRSGSQSLFL